MEGSALLNSGVFHDPVKSISSSFLDTSHLQFYATPKWAGFKRANRHRSQFPAFAAISEEGTIFSKDLDDLRPKIKSQKEELKAKKKEMKMLKEDMKGKKRGKKVKDKVCDSSSSSESSSESDCEKGVNFAHIRIESLVSAEQDDEGNDTVPIVDTVAYPVAETLSSLSIQGITPTLTDNSSLLLQAMAMVEQGDIAPLPCGLNFAGFSNPVLKPLSQNHQGTGKIEICMGGKCRKNGAQQVVAAFQAGVANCPEVAVSSCKCMGKCSSGPNVRLSNHQIYSGVNPNDADLILQHEIQLSGQAQFPWIAA